MTLTVVQVEIHNPPLMAGREMAACRRDNEAVAISLQREIVGDDELRQHLIVVPHPQSVDPVWGRNTHWNAVLTVVSQTALNFHDLRLSPYLSTGIHHCFHVVGECETVQSHAGNTEEALLPAGV